MKYGRRIVAVTKMLHCCSFLFNTPGEEKSCCPCCATPPSFLYDFIYYC